MSLWDLISGSWLGKIGEAISWTGGQVANWQAGQTALSTAKLEAKIAALKAEAEIAAYKAKSNLEWDLKWADDATHSWKDEFLLILWSIPTIGLFIPFTRPFIIDGFEYLKTFNPDAPNWYLAGWAIIFAATFGIRQALQFMLPGKFANLVTTMGAVRPDIPDDAIKAIDARLQAGKATTP